MQQAAILTRTTILSSPSSWSHFWHFSTLRRRTPGFLIPAKRPFTASGARQHNPDKFTVTTPIHICQPRRHKATLSLDPAPGTDITENPCYGPRWNSVNTQLLPLALHRVLFSSAQRSTQVRHPLQSQAHQHLDAHGIPWRTKRDPIPPQGIANFPVPSLIAPTIQDHVMTLSRKPRYGTAYAHACALAKLADLPPRPSKWEVEMSGWTKYTTDKNGHATCVPVPFPEEGEDLVFDVETFVPGSNYPILATAVSSSHWYSWVSPAFVDINEGDDQETISSKLDGHLIPMGLSDRLVVGFRVGYDRARVLEEYDFQATPSIMWIDALSLHAATAGMCTQQIKAYGNYNKSSSKGPASVPEIDSKSRLDSDGTSSDAYKTFGDQHWQDLTCRNTLAELALNYCDITLDKKIRNTFISGTFRDVKDDVQNLMQYCAIDVETTWKIFVSLWPRYEYHLGHPASFSGMLNLMRCYLPISERWDDYVDVSERFLTESQQEAQKALARLATQLLQRYISVEDGDRLPDRLTDQFHFTESVGLERYRQVFVDKSAISRDAWARHLDWTVTKMNFLKPKAKEKKDLDPMECPVEDLRPWKAQVLPNYPKWFRELWQPSTRNLRVTTKSRVAPYLMRLSWEGRPVYHCKERGWCTSINDTPQRIPHPDGPMQNCGNPLAKGYTKDYEAGTLTSEEPIAKEALEQQSLLSYWVSSRSRVRSQLVVWKDVLKVPHNYPYTFSGLNMEPAPGETRVGAILPYVTPMGTVTRRAVEPMWMTASNPKKGRVGSEVKTQVQAPKGYSIIGADVDSQELWIASLFGDAQFRIHGGTALGWMTLQGNKKEATDLHSKTAKILGGSRDLAKVFNYARIYGASTTFAQNILKAKAGVDEKTAKAKAKDLYVHTKGFKYSEKAHRETIEHLFGGMRGIWCGGSESFMFNALETVANYEDPRTPILNAQLSDALKFAGYLRQYGRSRNNWVVQSSAVDYLHLLLLFMEHLITHYKLRARLLLSIHDEVRYISHSEDALLVAWALQVSNVWTRTFFAARLGFNDLPLSVAFFGGVEIDSVLRKESWETCETPTNWASFQAGETLTVQELYERLNESGKLGSLFSRAGSWKEAVYHDAREDFRVYDNDDLDDSRIGMQLCARRDDVRQLLSKIPTPSAAARGPDTSHQNGTFDTTTHTEVDPTRLDMVTEHMPSENHQRCSPVPESSHSECLYPEHMMHLMQGAPGRSRHTVPNKSSRSVSQGRTCLIEGSQLSFANVDEHGRPRMCSETVGGAEAMAPAGEAGAPEGSNQ